MLPQAQYAPANWTVAQHTTHDLLGSVHRKAKDLNGYQKAILIVLVDYSNSKGSCYPSMKRIADESGFSLRTVQNHLPVLIKLGYVRMFTPGKGHKSKTYYLNLGKLLSAENASNKSESDAPLEVQDVHPKKTIDKSIGTSTRSASGKPRTARVSRKRNYESIPNLNVSAYKDWLKYCEQMEFNEWRENEPLSRHLRREHALQEFSQTEQSEMVDTAIMNECDRINRWPIVVTIDRRKQSNPVDKYNDLCEQFGLTKAQRRKQHEDAYDELLANPQPRYQYKPKPFDPTVKG